MEVPVLCNCGRKPQIKNLIVGDHWVQCAHCSTMTDYFVTREAAIESWNHLMERPNKKSTSVQPEIHEIVSCSFDDFSSLKLMMKSALIDYRDHINSRLEQLCGKKFTYVLSNYGDINDWWEPSNMVMQDELGLCVAFDIQPGLITLKVYKKG